MSNVDMLMTLCIVCGICCSCCLSNVDMLIWMALRIYVRRSCVDMLMACCLSFVLFVDRVVCLV